MSLDADPTPPPSALPPPHLLSPSVLSPLVSRYLLDERTVHELTAASRRTLHEVCGIICPPCQDHFDPATGPCSRVVELRNVALEQALDPASAYVMNGSALSVAMTTFLDTHESFRATLTREAEEANAAREQLVHPLRRHFTIWHTHPNGFTGPSQRDIHTKTPGFSYLVVALKRHEGGSTVNMAWF